MFIRSLMVLVFLTFSTNSSAETKNINWSAQLSGLDGVTVTCANANKEKYAAGICAEMLKRISEKFETANIKTSVLGSYFVKTEEAPAKPSDMATPLEITVFVRSTNSDGVYAINLRNQISVAYEKAVEEGTSGSGRKGNLVMWEGSTTGSGPRKQLSAAIAGASFQKIGEQIDEIIKVWPK